MVRHVGCDALLRKQAAVHPGVNCGLFFHQNSPFAVSGRSAFYGVQQSNNFVAIINDADEPSGI